jgi:hypothetical protein
MKADIRVVNYGTVVMLEPKTQAGKKWLDENCQAESWQWYGGALAAEPRMVQDVIDGAELDGLNVAV